MQMTFNGRKVDLLATMSGLHLARNWQIVENDLDGIQTPTDARAKNFVKGFILIDK